MQVECKHKQIILIPEPSNVHKAKGGLTIGLHTFTPLCKSCDVQIAEEDVWLYDEKNVFVGIDASMVDDD